MGSGPNAKPGFGRVGFDFSEIDPRETLKAWNKFLSNRNAPSLPVTGVRSMIYQSWIRSTSTGVKPDTFAAPSRERGAAMTQSTYDHAELRRATRASLTQIAELLSGAEAMLILTDRDGVILETMGDNSTLNKAYKINLSVGGVWSESASGTNGIGTALWAGYPVYVHGEEHFCEGMKAWSCAAAPIRDPVDRSIIGIINLSGLTTIFRKHNAAFAATAARDIEVALEQEQSLLNIRMLEAIIGKFPAQALEPTERLAIVDRFGRLVFRHGSGAEAGRAQAQAAFGTRFLNLQEGLTENSEERVLAAVPEDQVCEDVRLIDIDGEIKGAALVLRPSDKAVPVRRLAPVRTLPGVAIKGTDMMIVGESDVMLEALDTANRIANVNTPTLIEGQTGVGKELFARLIHSRMDPGSQRFSAVNCGAIAPQMFGEGLLRPLESGQAAPVCLDEIGELPPDVQPFLLRVLEERLTLPTAPGGSQPPVRVVSLTNRVLLDEVAAGRFRHDLFYRLSTVTLRIPPLRDRGEDVLLIAEYYNRKIAAETGQDLLVIGSEVQAALMAHSWPGNVRELRNAVSGLHYLAKSRHVTLADLPSEITSPARPVIPVAANGAPLDSVPSRTVSLKHAEVVLIETSLAQFHGNISKAAAALGISRPTLYRKIQTLGIGADAARPARARRY